jgi:hypothetical protein
MPLNMALILMIAGPSRTMKMAGNMKTASGKIIYRGAVAARLSLRISHARDSTGLGGAGARAHVCLVRDPEIGVVGA